MIRSFDIAAHECILDFRAFHSVTAEDVAEAADGSRLSCANTFMAGCRNVDGRAN